MKLKYVSPQSILFKICAEGMMAASSGNSSFEIDSNVQYGNGEIEQRSQQKSPFDNSFDAYE